ncbi:SCO family protein [Deinococcus pimensis]|uniref:SCO family protein n=1 Tax=Deinococcus pimensis TaxID=309888 RepID=UPI0005EB7A96|nr:SCO family protein [Deinococcus pimensis]
MPRLITAVLVAVALVLGGVLAYRTVLAPLGGTVVQNAPRVPDEALVSDAGKAARLSDFGGGTRLVFFGFTRCPDVCPATLGVLARAYENLSEGQKERVKVMLVSVDPGNDKPEVLRAYLRRFNPDFRGFTGTEEALRRMEAGFFVYARHDEEHDSFVHGDTVAVVDAEGRMRRVYTQDDVASGTLARDLPRLAAGRI